jgi:hypothetical protein
VLKTLYESLIDPRQRHDLGEYYTPGWLAERMCVRAIPDSLCQRVLDPACGSGTFPFHAVRRLHVELPRFRGRSPSHSLSGWTRTIAVLGGTEIADAGVAADPVVEDLDLLEHRGRGLGWARSVRPVDELGLEGREEALRHGVEAPISRQAASSGVGWRSG